jgi:hypothetical protein
MSQIHRTDEISNMSIRFSCFVYEQTSKHEPCKQAEQEKKLKNDIVRYLHPGVCIACFRRKATLAENRKVSTWYPQGKDSQEQVNIYNGVTFKSLDEAILSMELKTKNIKNSPEDKLTLSIETSFCAEVWTSSDFCFCFDLPSRFRARSAASFA